VFPSPCQFQEKDVQLPFDYMKITHKKQGWIVKQQTGALRLRIKVKSERLNVKGQRSKVKGGRSASLEERPGGLEVRGGRQWV